MHGARAALANADVDNVTVALGDGALGHPDRAPYDRIIATVGAHALPQAWLDQLAPGGRLPAPLRLRGAVSRSIAIERIDGAWRSVGSGMNAFMPLRRRIAQGCRRLVPSAELLLGLALAAEVEWDTDETLWQASNRLLLDAAATEWASTRGARSFWTAASPSTRPSPWCSVVRPCPSRRRPDGRA